MYTDHEHRHDYSQDATFKYIDQSFVHIRSGVSSLSSSDKINTKKNPSQQYSIAILAQLFRTFRKQVTFLSELEKKSYQTNINNKRKKSSHPTKLAETPCDAQCYPNMNDAPANVLNTPTVRFLHADVGVLLEHSANGSTLRARRNTLVGAALLGRQRVANATG